MAVPPGPPPPLPDRPPGTVLAATALGVLLACRGVWGTVALGHLGRATAVDTGTGFVDGLQRALGGLLLTASGFVGLLALGLAAGVALAWTGRGRLPLLVAAGVLAVLEALSSVTPLVLPGSLQALVGVSPLVVALGTGAVVLLALPTAVQFDAVHAAHRRYRATPSYPAAPDPLWRPSP